MHYSHCYGNGKSLYNMKHATAKASQTTLANYCCKIINNAFIIEQCTLYVTLNHHAHMINIKKPYRFLYHAVSIGGFKGGLGGIGPSSEKISYGKSLKCALAWLVMGPSVY